MTERKKPRRTAERILEVTLALFNRFGEPNVSTTLISAELDISPGNLYYHYPAKDELINALFDRYERALGELLGAADGVENVEDAWLFVHMLFELVWQYRFLYRDLNDLLSRNRRLETHLQSVLERKRRAMHALLDGLSGEAETVLASGALAAAGLAGGERHRDAAAELGLEDVVSADGDGHHRDDGEQSARAQQHRTDRDPVDAREERA